MANLQGELSLRQAETRALQQRVDAFESRAQGLQADISEARKKAEAVERERSETQLQLSVARSQAEVAKTSAISVGSATVDAGADSAELRRRLDAAAETIARLVAEVNLPLFPTEAP